MSHSIKELMRNFEYDDKRISHLLGMFDDFVETIKDYDDQFEFDEKRNEKAMLSGYQNTAFGILLSLLQLGHITTAVDVMLASTLKNDTNNTAIIDASSRFVAQGGRWHPSPSLERRVCQAALDEVKYQRL